MVTKIDNIDIGTVTNIEDVGTKQFNTAAPSGAVSEFELNMQVQSKQWRVEGELYDPTQTTLEQLLQIRDHGLLVLADLDDVSPYRIAWGKIRSLRLFEEDREYGVKKYEILFKLQTAIGHSHMQTANAYLHDLSYRPKLNTLDPHFANCNKTYDSTRRKLTYDFYLDNYLATIQTLQTEIQVGDDFYESYVYYYYNGAWVTIAKWGGSGYSFGTIRTFTDQDGFTHDITLDRGNRGEATENGIGTLSLRLGCNKRMLLHVTNMQPPTGSHLSTRHGTNQLLLRIAPLHNLRESLRPNPYITYIEGGTEDGNA